ncbi:hypothetical protein FQA39_LY03511 [Lamprigera yunnana]|nr:hypothetical protein FQA39_LY03511 [Lamprigera yunnana]
MPISKDINILLCFMCLCVLTQCQRCVEIEGYIQSTVKLMCDGTSAFPIPSKVVTVFECFNCNILVLDQNTIVKRYEGVFFNLSSSHVQVIREDAFKSFRNVRNFNFENNQINYIAPKAFSHFPTLEHLIFRNSQIVKLNQKQFEDTRITYLDISKNYISSLEGVFDGLQVGLLNLSQNHIADVPKGAFKKVLFNLEKGNAKSQYLDLSSNSIGLLEPEVFGCANDRNCIRILDLQRNVITAIEDGTFSDLVYLEVLILSKNNIFKLHPHSFRNLINLNSLFLQNNKIGFLPIGVFSELQKLVVLDLSQNSFGMPSDKTFNGLSNLQTLNLSHNNLGVLKNSFFATLGQLKTLDITNVRITNITIKPFLEYHFRLRTLILNDNFWTCQHLMRIYRQMNLQFGGFSSPAKHFDVPNLHGIACSRGRLMSYQNLTFKDFYNIISQDREFIEALEMKMMDESEAHNASNSENSTLRGGMDSLYSVDCLINGIESILFLSFGIAFVGNVSSLCHELQITLHILYLGKCAIVNGEIDVVDIPESYFKKILMDRLGAIVMLQLLESCQENSAGYVPTYGFRTIELVCKNVEKIPTTTKTVSRFSCENCNIRTLDENNTVKNFKGTIFNMTNGAVEVIKKNAFENFPKNMVRFLFNNNKITYIEPLTFSNFSSLIEIILTHNEISSLDKGAFDQTDLRLLDLSYNHISKVSGIFEGLRFGKLNVSYNDIIDVPDFSELNFEKLAYDSFIDFSNNKIRRISSNSLSCENKAKCVQALYFHQNLIITIENNTFAKVPLLQKLMLNSNKILSLQKDSFKGLSKLVVLQLQSNNISFIPRGLFHDLSQLSTLDLSQNSLTALEIDVFSGLTNLNKLNISHNNLHSLADIHFFPLGKLNTLDISNTRLHNFDMKEALQHHRRLYVIILNDNFWTCSQLATFYKMLNHKSGGFSQPSRHFDVPNLHGIACSREPLISYADLTFEDFLTIISEDKIFEDLYNIQVQHDQVEGEINDAIKHISTINSMFVNDVLVYLSEDAGIVVVSLCGPVSCISVITDQRVSKVVLDIELSVGITMHQTTRLTLFILCAFYLNPCELESCQENSGGYLPRYGFQTIELRCKNVEKIPTTTKIVTRFSCENCNVRTLDENNTVKNFKGIIFNMTHGAVEVIKKTAFENFPKNMVRFLFNNNKITYIEPLTFSNFSTLIKIILTHNEISSLDKGTFDQTGLRLLDLSHNHISKVSGIFEGLRFGKLNVSYNDIVDVPDFSELNFEKLAYDSFIDFSNNKIRRISSNSLSCENKAKCVQALYFHQNLITTIENNTFAKVPLLQKLMLNSNKILSLQKDSFKGLSKLVVLQLQSNNISFIPRGLFHDLSQLSTLDLSQNSLTALEIDVFSGLTNLNKLNISHNNLYSLADIHFFPLGKLNTLDISNTRLHNFDMKEALQHHRRLYVIILNDNFWTCSQLATFYKMLNHKSGGFSQPSRHFDVPNLHGIACSREPLISYADLTFEDFLTIISEDKIFEDLYNIQVQYDQVEGEINDAIKHISTINSMFVVLTIIAVMVLLKFLFQCSVLVLQRFEIIKLSKGINLFI